MAEAYDCLLLTREMPGFVEDGVSVGKGTAVPFFHISLPPL